MVPDFTELVPEAGIQLLPGDILRQIPGKMTLPGPPSVLFNLNQDRAVDVADLVKLLSAPRPIP